MGIGNYVELTPQMLDDGDFMRKLGKKLSHAVRELNRHEKETGRLTDKVKLKTEIIIKRAANSNEFYDIDYAFNVSVPEQKFGTKARGGAGRLLIDPDGDSLNDGDQMVLPTFDRMGEQKGHVDLKTGEEVPADEATEETTAGKIG